MGIKKYELNNQKIKNMTTRTEILLSEHDKATAIKKAGLEGQKNRLSAAIRYCIDNAKEVKISPLKTKK